MKVKIVADSACDLTPQYVKENSIDIEPILILAKDKIYRDFYDFAPKDFFKFIVNQKESLSTSQATPLMFIESFNRAKAEGYDAILCIILNSLASGTYQSAVMAKEAFLDENEGFRVELVDTTTYAYLIGYLIERTIDRLNSGMDLDDAIKILKEESVRMEAYVVTYTLEYLKRSGRINSVAGIMGDVLNIKPILHIGNAQVNVIEKVRGTKKVNERLIALVKEHYDPNNRELLLLLGDMDEEADELEKVIKEEFDIDKIKRAYIGSVITVNAGPKIMGIGFLKK